MKGNNQNKINQVVGNDANNATGAGSTSNNAATVNGEYELSIIKNNMKEYSALLDDHRPIPENLAIFFASLEVDIQDLGLSQDEETFLNLIMKLSRSSLDKKDGNMQQNAINGQASEPEGQNDVSNNQTGFLFATNERGKPIVESTKGYVIRSASSLLTYDAFSEAVKASGNYALDSSLNLSTTVWDYHKDEEWTNSLIVVPFAPVALCQGGAPNRTIWAGGYIHQDSKVAGGELSAFNGEKEIKVSISYGHKGPIWVEIVFDLVNQVGQIYAIENDNYRIVIPATGISDALSPVPVPPINLRPNQ